MPKVLNKLNSEHIEQLTVLSKNSNFGQSYWQIVEDSLINKKSIYNIYECDCGGVFLLTKSEYTRLINEEFGNCFHDVLLEYSASIQDSIVDSKVKQISTYLKNKNISQAIQTGIGILPIDSFDSFDYGLWQLQLAQSFDIYYEASSVEKRKLYINQYVIELFELYNRAAKNNQSELKKFMAAMLQSEAAIKLEEKVFNAVSKKIESVDIFEKAAYQRVTGSYLPDNHPTASNDDLIKRSIQLHLDAYHAYIEISEIYLFLINLIQISKGYKYSSEPFKGKKVTVGNKSINIHDKKGLQCKYICINANSSLRKKIDLSLDNKLRNGTSGHNDYVVDTKNKKITINKTNQSYSYNFVKDKFLRLKNLVDVILLIVELSKYEDHITLPLRGFWAWGLHFEEKTDHAKNELTVHQFWSNAELDPKGKSFTMAKFKYNKKLNSIELQLSERDLSSLTSLPPSEKFIRWLDNIANLGELRLCRTVITPRISSFRYRAHAVFEDQFAKFYVLGESTHTLPVEKKHLKSTIRRIKKHAKLHPDMKSERFRVDTLPTTT